MSCNVKGMQNISLVQTELGDVIIVVSTENIAKHTCTRWQYQAGLTVYLSNGLLCECWHSQLPPAHTLWA